MGGKKGWVVKRKCWQERECFSATGVRQPDHFAGRNKSGTKTAGTRIREHLPRFWGAADLVRSSLGRLRHCGFFFGPTGSPPPPAQSMIGANLPSRHSLSGDALLIPVGRLPDPIGRITRSRQAVSYPFLGVPFLLALYEIDSVPPTHKRGVHVLRFLDCVDCPNHQVPLVSPRWTA